MKMNFLRSGSGKPLLLVHGLGGSARSWSTIWPALAARRDVIAVDLPGFGETPPLAGETTIRSLSNAVTAFIDAQGLRGVDVVGSSMGARQPFMPVISRSKVARTMLLAQFSRRPWALDSEVVLDEMRSYARAPAFDELLYQLAYGEEQEGAARGSIEAPLVIGWGRNDKVCFTSQAKRALALFPDARLHWFERCGHFPHWDAPQETVRLILNTCARQIGASTAETPVAQSGILGAGAGAH